MTYEVFWILLVLIFVIAEAVTSGLVSIWFALGALAGLICSAVGAELWVQIAVFFAVSIVSLLVIRRWAKKGASQKTAKTDIDRIIGTLVIISETVDNINHTGMTRINDVEWKVKSSSGAVIEEGQKARIVGVEGVSLVVEKVI